MEKHQKITLDHVRETIRPCSRTSATALNYRERYFDCNLASGESLVRQILYGTKFFREEFGVENRVLRGGELYREYHRGTYTTHAAIKQANRQSEFLLRDAEFLAAICPCGESGYPADALEAAWKRVLLNQFHDIFPGSSIPRVYEDAERDYAVVRDTGEEIIARSLQAFATHFDTAQLTNPLMVWNTLSFTRGGLVSLPWQGKDNVMAVPPRGAPTRTQVSEADGERRLLVECADLPAMGYTVYDLLEEEWYEEGWDAVTATPWVLENDLVRVELNALGEIISFLDKHQQRELIAPRETGNHFQLFDDLPIHHEAWDIDQFYADVERELGQTATLSIVEQGPLRATIRVERQLTPHARLTQDIRLEANTRRVDFVTTVDWQETHALLKVAFPVALYSPRATYEIQFGHLERPTHGKTSWDVARFEVPAHKWADLSEGDYGVALLNDCKYGYDIHGNVLRLSLLRAPKSPDAQADMGTHRFTYCLLPHRGDVVNSGVPLAGYDVNVPLRAQAVAVQEGALSLTHSFFRVDAPNLIIESVKRAEDGDGLIVRLYEAYRRRGTGKIFVNGLCAHATRCDLLERDQQDIPVMGGAVEIPYRPFEIITLRLR